MKERLEILKSPDHLFSTVHAMHEDKRIDDIADVANTDGKENDASMFVTRRSQLQEVIILCHQHSTAVHRSPDMIDISSTAQACLVGS